MLPQNYRPLSITSGIHIAADRTPSKIALQEGSRKLSYRELSDHIRLVAQQLILLGLSRGMRVAVLAPNCLEYPELVCGIADAGLVAVTLNPRAHPHELSEILDDSAALAIFIHPSLEAQAAAINAPTLRWRISMDAHYQVWRDKPTAAVRLPILTEFDPFVLVYTSGTTGRAKGVLLPHRARTLLFFAKALEYGCYGPNDRHLGIAPLCSGGGFGFSMCALFFGGFLEIMPAFEPAAVLAKLAEEDFTGVFVVPSHLHAIFALDPALLARHQGRAWPLRAIISNAAALPLVLKQKAVAYWGEGRLHETYGFTEAGIVANLRPEHQLSKPGSVGTAFPLCDVRLLDESGADVPEGEVGELFVSSPYLFNGYWQKSEETAACMRDSWISAGDLARRDADGCYTIVDRKKDMVISGGYNIYPREIEEVLFKHPSIADCAVIGVADDRWGEKLRAYLVLKPASSIDTEEVQLFCRSGLASYKIPREIVVLDDLPRNANGKVLKRLLRNNI
jgi:acyl-CoA synthetase (AMP-forming)/AMP-acid ligase II